MNVAVGEHKLSISITRKTVGDLIVSNYGIERYYRTDEEAASSLSRVLGSLAELVPGVHDDRRRDIWHLDVEGRPVTVVGEAVAVERLRGLLEEYVSAAAAAMDGVP